MTETRSVTALDLRPRKRLPAGVQEIFVPLLRDLDHLAGEAQRLFSAAEAPSASDLGALRETVFAFLAQHGDLAVGCGLVVVPGVLADRDRHLEWWWVRGDRGPESLRVNLDQSAPDAYDYTRFEWFDAPLATGQSVLTGPYLDVACTNQYVMTIGTPVLVGGRPVAVAAADLPMERVERLLMPILGEIGACVLVNRHGRVVASTIPAVLPGTRLPVGTESAQTRAPVPPWELYVPRR